MILVPTCAHISGTLVLLRLRRGKWHPRTTSQVRSSSYLTTHQQSHFLLSLSQCSDLSNKMSNFTEIFPSSIQPQGIEMCVCVRGLLLSAGISPLVPGPLALISYIPPRTMCMPDYSIVYRDYQFSAVSSIKQLQVTTVGSCGIQCAQLKFFHWPS